MHVESPEFPFVRVCVLLMSRSKDLKTFEGVREVGVRREPRPETFKGMVFRKESRSVHFV